MINVYGMKSESEMPDGEYFVKDQFREPEHPQQNPAELCAIKFLKDHSQVLLNQTGAPEDCWLLACEYIANVHNISADKTIGYQIPCELCHGGLQDISAFLEYKFYECVFYLDSDQSFPSTKEKTGWWVGVTSNVREGT